MLFSTEQIQHRLIRVHGLMESSEFHRDSREEGIWKEVFAEMITGVDELLSQSQQRGNRIDFMEGVGVNGKIQDITSLVEWMRGHLPELVAELPGQLAGNRLNRYFDQGTGYFANGSFFTADYGNELAFFIDDQRIYLKHHIGRAVHEVELHLAA